MPNQSIFSIVNVNFAVFNHLNSRSVNQLQIETGC